MVSSSLSRLGASIVLAAGLTSAFSQATPAAEFGADYFATIRGFPIGSAKLRANIDGERYDVRLSARVGGLARLFSDMETSLSATGSIGEGKLEPKRYNHEWREDDDAEVASFSILDGRAQDVVVEPPPRRPERRVPIGTSDLDGVIDLATAFLWQVQGQPRPSSCSRTLRLFDGTQRFDLAFSFDRTETFEARDGSYAGPAIVCAIRFHPISGHRRDKAVVAFMAANENIEVWMAPATDSFAIPVKIRLRTQKGVFGLEARSLVTS